MLWPTLLRLTRMVEGTSIDVYRYGFVNVDGDLVVPERYDGYQNCPDAAGRTAFVLAFAPGDKTDVLDLTGTVIARVPTQEAMCGGAGHVLAVRPVEPELGKYDDGVFDVASGTMILALATDRHVDVVDPGTLNVSDPGGEYFFELGTGKRTAHPGWLTTAGLESDAPAAPAAAKRTDNAPDVDSGIGFIDRGGRWVVSPGLQDASAFRHGHAVIRTGGEFTFLDVGLRRVGGEWDDVEALEVSVGSAPDLVGYQVTRDGQQGILGPDLRVIVSPGDSEIQCSTDAVAACAVVADDGTADLVAFPEGSLGPMPAGFSQALSRTFLADRLPADNNAARRIYARPGATAIELAGPSSCRGVGPDWVACEPESPPLPPVVFDAAGARAPFRTIEAVAEPSTEGGVAYYWVTAGRYQGFVDSGGAWRYRENRFAELED